ncbi:MAG: enoyl-CoA hydratase/isomerase family protein [Gemmataceae bacterium]|nr:enoyl-CoA hydratase/isomerase family protein [Gemmataceae bacterium]
MLFESAHVRITAEYGTATLWLDFPGDPVNALDVARLRELDAAVAAVSRTPFVRILVVRSAKPAGFCAGIHPEALASLTTDADRAAFAGYGQAVADRLAGLDAVTVAVIDGPCLGAGLELALACDHRLCVARPTTHLGFPDAPHNILACFGGTGRLRDRVGRRHADQLTASGRTLSGREARALGLVDHAFCERRAKIELRTFLDRLETPSWRTGKRGPVAGAGLPTERRSFVRALATAAAQARMARHLEALWAPRIRPAPINPVPPFPAVVGLVGEADEPSRVAAEVALRGGEVVVCGPGAGVSAGIAVALARGFVTPLEADQARSRVKASQSLDGFDRAGLVFVAGDRSLSGLADVVRPRCVVATPDGVPPARAFPHPRRVLGVRFGSDYAEMVRGPDTDPDTVAALAAWLKPFGFIQPPDAALSPPDRIAA